MDTYFNRSPQEALEAIGSTSGGLTTGKAEEKLKTTPSSECALNALAIDEPQEYARLYLEGNLQM